jgi:acetyl esterase/lipase
VLSYGAHPHQYGEVWLPSGKGPFPVVLLVHGGCWLAALPATELVALMAEDLRQRGYFVWSIDYRRIGDEAGGYPATFLDTAKAADELKALAAPYPIDLMRVVAVGHSAGGHLANWLAARKSIPSTSPLHAATPLAIRGVVSLAGINDLKAYRATGPDACGGPPTIDALTGVAARQGQDVYADTSPAEMLPTGTRLAVLSGDLDRIVPSSFGDAFGAQAKRSGDSVVVRTFVNAGHFDLIDPQSAAWPGIVAEIDGIIR